LNDAIIRNNIKNGNEVLFRFHFMGGSSEMEGIYQMQQKHSFRCISKKDVNSFYRLVY